MFLKDLENRFAAAVACDLLTFWRIQTEQWTITFIGQNLCFAGSSFRLIP